MPTNSLSDARCKASKPADKPYKLFDGGGLFLYVAESGSKIWRCAYRLNGKPKTKSFGPYPEVSLSEAREKRDALKKSLRDGDDPMADRKAKRKGITFAEACSEYFGGRDDISPSYKKNATRGLEMHLYAGLGDRNISSIGRADLLIELNKMNAAGLYDYVRKVRMWSSQVFSWAVEHGHTEINPASLIDPEKAFGKRTVESFAALDYHELPEFIERLRMERDLQSVLACWMLAYTWVRTNELRMMTWSEIKGDTWLIPEGKMKRRKDHIVPLSTQAQEIIEQMKARSNGSDYVFPHPFRKDRPMSENAVLYMIGRMGFKGRMTGHGFRSVGSTWANENGYNPDAIERQLAHVPENKVRSAYNRAAYLDERRKMLQDWADWLSSN